MKTLNFLSRRHLGRKAVLAALTLWVSFALAGPGAHGPGGEHLDGPSTGATASGTPRLEANSEMFELVGHLYAEELSLLIDRYETNAPVLHATVEVETGAIKAIAKFHADHGDYAVDDARLLAVLRRPGEHALVFTIVAGQDSDLLDATLVNRGSEAAPAGSPGQVLRTGLWVLAVVMLTGLAGFYGWRRRRQGRSASNLGARS